MGSDIILNLAIIVILLVICAFFSASETSLGATSRARMHEPERRGDIRAVVVKELLAMRERLIGAILLGSNLVKIAAAALAAGVLLRIYGEVGVLYAIVAVTLLVLLFGEVLPRTYALLNADRVALRVAPLLRIAVSLLRPLAVLVEFPVRHTLRLTGADFTKAGRAPSPQDELRGAIALHRREGSGAKKDHDMLGGILDLQDLTVRDVMVHRTKMVTVERSESPASIIEDVLKSGHTRLPVWKDTPENIIGVLHAKDLLKDLQKHNGDASRIDLEDIILPPWFVPDTRPVADQLSAFLRRKTHFALVVDEYGEVMGLVTLEDIIEEIVGDIADEHDVAVAGVRPEPGGAYVVEGIVPVRDLNRLNDWDLPDEEVTTVAGLVIHEAQMIPDVGQAFTFHGFRFEVLRKRRHQITSLRITPVRKRRAQSPPSLKAQAS
jgi:Mg2+/Co2+ transporter CorB